MDDDNLLLKFYRIFFNFFFCVFNFFIEIWFDVSKKEWSGKILIYKDRKKTKNQSKPQIVPIDIKKTNRQTDIQIIDEKHLRCKNFL
jgi:hypothetical protein